MTRSRTIIATLIAASALLAPATGHAAPINECGDYTDHGNGRMTWGYGPTSGAGIFNMTTRSVSCATARQAVIRQRFAGYSCRRRGSLRVSAETEIDGLPVTPSSSGMDPRG